MAGCGGDVDLFVPSPPADAAHRTRILAVLDDGGVEAVVFALDGRDTVQGRFARDVAADDVQIYALDYAQSLEDLEMVGGRLGPATRDERPCALGAPAVVRRADVRDRAASAWLTIAASDVRKEIVEHLIRAEGSCKEIDLCRSVRSVTYAINDVANIEIIVRIDESTALVGSRAQRFVTATRDGVTARPQLDGYPSLAATMDRDGNLWLGGRGGRVLYGTPLTPMTALPIPDTGYGVEALHVTREGLVYAVAMTDSSTSTQFLRHDGTEWRVLDRHAEPASGSHSSNAAIVEMRDGTLVAINGSATVWVVAPDGTVDRTTPPYDNRFTAITVHPRLGVAIGTDLGWMYTSLSPLSGDWIRRGAPIARTIEAAGIYEDALLYGGANGILGQFYEGSVDCALDPGIGVDLNLMAVFDDGIIMGGGNISSGSNRVAWVVLD